MTPESPISRMFAPLVEQGADNYNRQRDLPKLIAVWPRELEDMSLGGTEAIIAHIKKVLNAVRVSAIADHWSYDLGRHVGLMCALRAEERRLTALRAHQQNCAGLARIVNLAAE